MSKLTPFALAAVALLGACSTTSTQPTTPRIVTNDNALRPGSGVVQAVMPTPMMASTGEQLRRLEIKMNDGRMQYVDTRSAEISKGDRVQLSNDGFIRKS